MAAMAALDNDGIKEETAAAAAATETEDGWSETQIPGVNGRISWPLTNNCLADVDGDDELVLAVCCCEECDCNDDGCV